MTPPSMALSPRRNRRVPTLDQFRTLCTIRTFETLILEYYGKGIFRGTTHTCLGQEAISVAALAALEPCDKVVSNHRSHGHYLAYCNDACGLLHEIAGLDEGISRGVGGSQHLLRDGFVSNGILGGMTPVAVGMALAAKISETGGIVICFLGDGMLGEGIVYESLNIASLWKAPILFVVENNRYAQSTPIDRNLAGSISGRAAAFGIETDEIESNDVGDLLERFEHAVESVRSSGKPFCQIVNTYRMGPHSKGDDLRDPNEIAIWSERDPLTLAKEYFEGDAVEVIENEVRSELHTLFESIGSRLAQNGASSSTIIDIDRVPNASQGGPTFLYRGDAIKQLAHLNRTLGGLLERHDEMLLLGEDIEDPYGGAFKVTRGLSERFGDRVRSTPISEAAIVGVAGGLARCGFRPVVEIMFGDFTTLIVDQLLNHICKFDRMYGEDTKCPVIIRTPMGGYRGYGPTHSQSLEKIFIGIPGLFVVASDVIHDQARVWDAMIASCKPTLYVENKGLYGQEMRAATEGKIGLFDVLYSGGAFPVTALQLSPSADPDVVILAYGGMVDTAMDTARSLFETEEVIARVVVISLISPLQSSEILEALGGCHRILVVEEGTRRAGWGAEVAATLLEVVGSNLRLSRVAALDTFIPASSAGEAYVLPSLARCLSAVKELLHGF